MPSLFLPKLFPPSDRMTTVDAGQALHLCAERGVMAQIVHRPAVRARDLHIGLTTMDLDPTLTVRERQRERLIDDREQSGPERWDYTITLEESANEMGLQVHLGSRSEFVPFLPVGVALVAAFGWRDRYETAAPALLDRERLERALVELCTGESTK